ncbi:hypothetical protein SAMN05421780_103158 [Flexibacter flexilis DSM 6793]|uniref:Dolichyl-phosphate-mannose-protein mannosyltransferase n=1 Tax=Flexibacter flexilis DSM 6793 TaxID=927664 RepID=A0A1I1H0P8_9BACT|nr:hypothetical protein [Flexibacter flexilis]SFC17345.1 hypothetical protein SAMN05421780_103158 [Flexibacter flexilis DSM 6793]
MNALKATVIFLSVLVLSLGLYIRVWSWKHHFTHCDDLLVATYMYVNTAPAEMEAHLLNGTKPKEENWVYNKLRHAHKIPVAGRFVGSIIKAYSDAETIMQGSSYAPLQFIGSSYLIRAADRHSYQSVLENGRFIPFVLSAIGVLLSFIVCYKINPSQTQTDKLITGALGAALTAFAWENIIYAGQMSSYAIGPCFFAAALWFFIAERKWDIKYYLILGFILSVCLLGQYQFLVIIPSFFVGSLVSWYINNKTQFRQQIIKALLYPLAAFIFIVPVVYKVLILTLKDKIDNNWAVKWNAGPNHEFLFGLPAGGLGEKIGYAFTFFGKNTWYIVESLTASTTPEGFYTHFITAIVLGLCFFGLYTAIKTQDKKMLGFWALFVCIMGTWVVLSVLQKITYSPTRHSLILQPLFVVGAVDGLIKLLSIIKNDLVKQYLPIGFVALHLVLFGVYMVQNQQERTEAFDAPKILALLEKHQVKDVVTRLYTYNLEILGWKRCESTEDLEKTNSNKLPTIFGFLSTRTPLKQWEEATPHDKEVVAQAEVLEKIEVYSSTQVEYLPLTSNGKNEVFFYVLRLPSTQNQLTQQ